MSKLDTLKTCGSFAWKLPRFLRQSISLEEARAIVLQRMAERETNFLNFVERGIFGYHRSPYRTLLKLAGCELGDIRKMVRTEGLEETLRALRNDGVYVTFEEFKGRSPIVRNGQVLPIQPQDFNNPFLSHAYQGQSGGTTGAGTLVGISLENLAAQAPLTMLVFHIHGVLGVPTAIWRGILPECTGMNNVLRPTQYGQVPQKWFSHVTTRDLKRKSYPRYLLNLLVPHYIILMARLFGVSIPWPQLVPLDKAIVVARWIDETLKAHGACLIRAHVSLAMRICLAAQEEGLDLSGSTFLGGGEPPTPAKVKAIISTGARWIPTYAFAEIGSVGVGCVNPQDGNDLHLLKDNLALIQHPRQVPGSEITVDAFYFTTLLHSARKVLLNVESDDYGVIENRTCGCPLESYGFKEHIRHLRSFSKLTGEGVTLAGSEMVKILEEVLPARFGGSPLDYQLLEEEDEQGFTRLSLLVGPKIDIREEREVIEAVFEALEQGSGVPAYWKQARTLQVKRMEPIWTGRGKLMPLHLLKKSKGPSS